MVTVFLMRLIPVAAGVRTVTANVAWLLSPSAITSGVEKLHWLPAACLLGLGIAAAFPMIAVLVVRGIGSGDLSLATATNRTSLQLGNAIGIAAAVALLGADTSAAAIGHFRLAWAVLAVLGTVCAVAIAVTGRPEPV